MPSTPTYIDQTLGSQQEALNKLAQQYCESGNEFVIGASLWVRPLINDFIKLVKERYAIITLYADKHQEMDKAVMAAADYMLDVSIELIVSAYPLTARGYVRSITSKIRNNLAIARLDASAHIKKSTTPSQSISPSHEILKEISLSETLNSEQFKSYCVRDSYDRLLATYAVFNSPLFNSVSLSCIRNRLRASSGRVSRLSDLSEKKFFNEKKIVTKKQSYETFFDAFRRYWKSLPYSNLYSAMAIQKLIHTPTLIKKIIRHRVDLKELLFICSPTMEIRKNILQEVLKNNCLSLTSVSSVLATLPEGKVLNWYIDLAEFGVANYLSFSAKKYGDTWLNSKRKIRADIYAQLLSKYRHDALLEKKIIIYTLIQNEKSNLCRFVSKAMGIKNVGFLTKQLWGSIVHDADMFKIDINDVNKIIEELAENIQSEKSLESSEYNETFKKLSKLIPHYDIKKSVF